MTIIKPTIGRKVWYHPGEFQKAGQFGMQQFGGEPLDATIIAVHGDGIVNLNVIDHLGKQFALTSVRLLQAGDEPYKDAEGNDLGNYAAWMPYQVGQAAKHAS